MSGLGGYGISGSPADASGSDALFKMLRLLSDSATLQAEYVRLDTARQDAKAVLDKVGPADEILKIRGEIDALKAQADAALASAKQEADQIVAGAQAQKSALIREGESAKLQAIQQGSQSVATGRRIQQDAEARLSEATKREQAVAERVEALDKRESELVSRETQVQAAYAEALALKGAIHETLADAHQKLVALGT